MKQLRGLAAELLRAHRVSDPVAFNKAMMSTQGQVDAFLISLAWVANMAMDQAITREAATALVAKIALDWPQQVTPLEEARDVWADAVAYLGALANEDEEAAKVLMRHTADMTLFLGYLSQAVATLFTALPTEFLALAMDELRGMQPPQVP